MNTQGIKKHPVEVVIVDSLIFGANFFFTWGFRALPSDRKIYRSSRTCSFVTLKVPLDFR